MQQKIKHKLTADSSLCTFYSNSSHAGYSVGVNAFALRSKKLNQISILRVDFFRVFIVEPFQRSSLAIDV